MTSVREVLLPWEGQPHGQATPSTRIPWRRLWLGTSARDLVADKAAGAIGSASTTGAGQGGTAFRLNGANSGIEFLSDASDLPTQTGTFVLVGGRTGGGSQTFDWGTRSTDVTERCGGHIPYSDDYIYFDFGGTVEAETRVQFYSVGLTFSARDVWVFTAGPRGMEIWQNGRLLTSNGLSTGRFPTSSGWGIGANGEASVPANCSGDVYAFGYCAEQLPMALLAELGGDFYGTALEPQRAVIRASGPAVVTGTSAQTNANDASTASGTTTVAGSVARTGSGDASSAAGTATVSGTSARTNANDTGGAVGTTTVVGTAARVGAADEAAASGSAGAVTGTVAVNEQGDAGNASGSGGNARGAGTGSHKVAIQDRGRILLFETEEEAETWLLAQAPQQEKTLVRAARKVARKVVRQESALAPVPYLAPRVITGTQEVKALINMRAALLQTRFDEEIKRQIAREMAEQEDEEMAAAVMLMMY